jgi:hypothetical protein
LIKLYFKTSDNYFKNNNKKMSKIIIYIAFLICLNLINNGISISIEIEQNPSFSSTINNQNDLFEQQNLIRTRKNNINKPKKNPRKNINVISAFLRFASKNAKFS